VWKTLTRLSCRACFPSARIRFIGAFLQDVF
jgi:hypothetical protein